MDRGRGALLDAVNADADAIHAEGNDSLLAALDRLVSAARAAATIRHVRAGRHECLRDALEAIERFPHLSLVAGFAFRPERAEGIQHFWASDGELVDPAQALYGPAAGLLGAPATPAQARRIAVQNGLPLPWPLRH